MAGRGLLSTFPPPRPYRFVACFMPSLPRGMGGGGALPRYRGIPLHASAPQPPSPWGTGFYCSHIHANHNLVTLIQHHRQAHCQTHHTSSAVCSTKHPYNWEARLRMLLCMA